MALFRCSSGGTSGGWTYKGSMTGSSVSTQNITISDLTVGKKYHIFSTCGSASASGATSNATLTAVSGSSNLTTENTVDGNANAYYGGIVEQSFTATATSAVFKRLSTATKQGYLLYEE